MDQERRQIEGYISDEQGTIQTTSHVLWAIQLTQDILKDNK